MNLNVVTFILVLQLAGCSQWAGPSLSAAPAAARVQPSPPAIGAAVLASADTSEPRMCR